MPHVFVPIPNCARVEMIYSQAGELQENVYHVIGSAPFSLANLQTLRGVFDSWDSVTDKVQRAAVSTLVRIRTRALDSAVGATEDYNLPVARAGTASGSAIPLNACFCVKLSTGLAGRSYRGRTYKSALTVNHLADSASITGGARDALVASLNTLRTSITTANAAWFLCVASTYTGGAWRVTGVCTPVINAVAVNTDLDSQKRRLRGRGST